MTDCKSSYGNLAQYNNGIAFKPWNSRAKSSIISSLKNNVFEKTHKVIITP